MLLTKSPRDLGTLLRVYSKWRLVCNSKYFCIFGFFAKICRNVFSVVTMVHEQAIDNGMHTKMSPYQARRSGAIRDYQGRCCIDSSDLAPNLLELCARFGSVWSKCLAFGSILRQRRHFGMAGERSSSWCGIERSGVWLDCPAQKLVLWISWLSCEVDSGTHL